MLWTLRLIGIIYVFPFLCWFLFSKWSKYRAYRKAVKRMIHISDNQTELANQRAKINDIQTDLDDWQEEMDFVNLQPSERRVASQLRSKLRIAKKKEGELALNWSKEKKKFNKPRSDT